MKYKVIVFGGAGFIGTYLVKELISRNYDVLVADIHPSQYCPEVRFVECDITDSAQVEHVMENGADYVYNLAGFAQIDKAIEMPVRAFQLNVMGNLNVLEAVRRKNVKRYIYSSSAYAMNNKGSFYGISKLSSEKIIEEYYKRYGLYYTILRFGSIYSELDFDNNYIYATVKEIVKTKKLVHNGDGEELREYVHAADAAKMAADVIDSDDYTNQYMILTGVETMKRKELFKMIEEILGEPVTVEFRCKGYENHYKLTPYSFNPTISRKMIAKSYIDIGQGILECIKNAKNSLL